MNIHDHNLKFMIGGTAADCITKIFMNCHPFTADLSVFQTQCY